MMRVSCVLALAAAERGAPNSLAWRPSSDNDAMRLIGHYDEAKALEDAEALEAQKRQALSLQAAAAKVKAQKLRKQQGEAQQQIESPTPELDSYIKGSQGIRRNLDKAGFSTRWTVQPHHASVTHTTTAAPAENRYMEELYGTAPAAPVAVDAASVQRPASTEPAAYGLGVSAALRGPIRDAVAQAESLEREAKGKRGEQEFVASWDPSDGRKPHTKASNAQLAIRQGTSVAGSASADAAAKDASTNSYMRFLVSRKDEVNLEAREAMQKASSSVRENGYARSINADMDYIALAK